LNPEAAAPRTAAPSDGDAASRAAPGADTAPDRPALSPAVSTVRVTYPDLHGAQRGKDVPLGELDRARQHGLAFCWAVMGTDLAHTPVVGGERGYPDMLARPDLSTLVEIPWEPDVAACLADLERQGEPEPTDMRGLVRRAEGALADLGLTAKIGPELEFFVLEPDGEGGWRRHVDNLRMVYTVGPQADPGGVLKGLLDGCAALGIGAIAANHEYMNSQYEINLSECGPLAASDNAFRLKAAVKDYSAQRGLLATFMGKPFNDQGGSGTHVHLSLQRDGVNCFDDSSGDQGLSPELHRFTAGVLEHAGALMAFLNPTVNAYRRILPDSLAPTHANWGLDNRTTFVRIPPDRGSGCRIELRVGDGAANPYLVTAAVIFAGIDGMRRELEPPGLLEGDTYTLPEEEQGDPLPMSLADALDALEADAPLRDAIGAEIIDTFVTMKRFELDRYRQHVSEWDLAEYMHHL
jgi:glutamine synthetase